MKTAMIMAAGLGTRMGELTQYCPKPLLPLGKHKIIDWTIRKIISAGFRRIVVNTHYLNEMMENHLQKNWSDKIELMISHEPQILGTGGGIAHAEKYFEDEPVLFCNSDVIADLDLNQFINFHLRSDFPASMVIQPSTDISNYSLIHYTKDMRLKSILPRGSRLPSSGFTGIFTGFHILSAETRKLLKPRFSSVIDDAYRRLLENEEQVGIFEHKGRWLDIGTEERYKNIYMEIENGIINLEDF